MSYAESTLMIFGGITLVMMACLFVVVPALLDAIKRPERRKKEAQREFFGAVDRGLQFQTVQDRSDLITLRDSVCRKHDVTLSLTALLEDYVLQLTSSRKDGGENHVAVSKAYGTIKAILQDERAEEPFAELPPEERRLLRSMNEAMKHDDKDALIHTLDELGAVISTRHRIYRRASLLNRWSVPFAILGIAMTILFGIMSLRSSFDSQRLDELIRSQAQVGTENSNGTASGLDAKSNDHRKSDFP